MRQLAGQIAALDTTAFDTRRHRTVLRAALGADDPAMLLQPLTEIAPRLARSHPEIAERINLLTRQVDQLRQAGGDRR